MTASSAGPIDSLVAHEIDVNTAARKLAISRQAVYKQLAGRLGAGYGIWKAQHRYRRETTHAARRLAELPACTVCGKPVEAVDHKACPGACRSELNRRRALEFARRTRSLTAAP